MSAVASPVGRYFGCSIPEANLKIQLNLDVIARLGMAVMEGFKLVPRRGLEVGGVLLGRIEDGCVIVDEFEAVASEHQRGPSYLLSDKDKTQLTEAVARANSGAEDKRVVGLYRSQTRAGFAPAEDDVALMEQHCAGAGNLFLLIKPEGAGQSTALFAAGDGLSAISEVFPFRGSMAPAAPRAETQRPITVQRPALPAAERVFDQPPTFEHIPRLQVNRVLEGIAAADQRRAPAITPRSGRRIARAAWTVGILLVAAAAGYGMARWWVQPAQPQGEARPASSLALHAKWSGASLDLQWDRNASVVRHANGAILWIEDGPKHRRLELSLDDLTQGSIQYWPTSSDVAFRLEVFTPDTKASESVRTVSLPVPEQVAPPDPAKSPRKPAESRRRSAAIQPGPGNS